MLTTYQGAVKNTRTGRERSFERTLSTNSFSVSIILPPDFAIPNRVVVKSLDDDDVLLIMFHFSSALIIKVGEGGDGDILDDV